MYKCVNVCVTNQEIKERVLIAYHIHICVRPSLKVAATGAQNTCRVQSTKYMCHILILKNIKIVRYTTRVHLKTNFFNDMYKIKNFIHVHSM